jgi:uncharacterized protein GlcG (DUF336 family)
MAVSKIQKVISWEAAHKAIGAAVARAETLGVRINVAVMDSGGNEAAFLRMPGAFLHSIEIARDKARTAAGFGVATGELYGMVSGSPSLRDGIIARPGLVAFGGGLPIHDGDCLIGGVGVSGGSEEQDVTCAQAALDALQE